MENTLQATIVLRRPDRPIRPGAPREEIEQALSADPADVDTVRRFAQAHGLRIERESAEERSVRVSGTPAQFEDAFGTSSAEPVLPNELKDAAVAILGIDQRPVAKPR